MVGGTLTLDHQLKLAEENGGWGFVGGWEGVIPPGGWFWSTVMVENGGWGFVGGWKGVIPPGG